MTKEAMLSRVGHVAVSWNEAERIIGRMLYLYLGTDVRTAEIVTKPMRPSDREKLLRELVRLKEVDPKVTDEINEALRICAICRDNRNTILHNSSDEDGSFAEKALDAVDRICSEFNEALSYLRAVHDAVTRMVILRDSRETPIGEESSPDELLPAVEFEQPERPKRPRRLSAQEVFRNAE